MRLIRILFTLLIFGMISAFDKLLKIRTKIACDGAEYVPSDVAFAFALLTFGKYFLVVAVILIILCL